MAAVTAKILGIPKQTLENRVRLAHKGQLNGAGDKPVSPEQMELARLRAENARLRMDCDILVKATAYFARVSVVVKLVVAFALIIQAAFCVLFDSLLGAVVGFRCTSMIAFQLQVEPDQRFGLA